MANTNYQNVSYSLSQGPLTTMAPFPISAKRAPTTADKNYSPGQLWIFNSSNLAYVLTSVINNSATWLLLESASGAGVFSSLVVTPGPISLTGTTNINITGSAVTTINGGAATGALLLGNATGNTAVTGTLTSSGNITATAGGITATAGNITATNGNVVLSTAATYISMPGPVFIYSGAGAPSNGLALHVGDMYINTTAASATTRIYVATAASTWTNVTCAA